VTKKPLPGEVKNDENASIPQMSLENYGYPSIQKIGIRGNDGAVLCQCYL
jgi:hypothetical protein